MSTLSGQLVSISCCLLVHHHNTTTYTAHSAAPCCSMPIMSCHSYTQSTCALSKTHTPVHAHSLCGSAHLCAWLLVSLSVLPPLALFHLYTQLVPLRLPQHTPRTPLSGTARTAFLTSYTCSCASSLISGRPSLVTSSPPHPGTHSKPLYGSQPNSQPMLLSFDIATPHLSSPA